MAWFSAFLAHGHLNSESGRAQLWLCTALSVLGGAACIIYAWQALRRKSSSRPPGPKGLPLIGHLHLLGDKPHRALFNLSKLHGPLMWLRFGSIPVIVASTPQAARLILQTHDQIFSGRPRTTAAVAAVYDCTDIVFSPPNAYWRLLRRICVRDVVSPKRIEAFRHVRDAEAHMLVRAIMKEIMQDIPVASDGSNAEPNPAPRQVMVAVRGHLLQASNDMISRMVLGKTLHEMALATVSHPFNLVHLLDEVLQCLDTFNLIDLLPSIAWTDIQGVRRRSRRVARRLDPILQDILDSRRQSRSSGSNMDSVTREDQDLLDLLLSLPSQEQITDDNIKAFVLDMFIGGTETSAYTIEWALTELLENPNELKLVQEEIEKVVGMDRLVQELDIPHLPYLRAIVNETMRLHPIIPFLVPHVATESCKLMGFDVLANTQAYVNAWAIGRDGNTWNEPLVFKPNRFLNNNLSVEGKSFELLAFGRGRRECPGSFLGLLNVQIQLASLVQGLNWWAPPNFDIQDKFGIMTTKEKPLVARVSPRLPTHLYKASI